MVNLSSALSIASQALSVTSSQTAIISRNVANANNTDYARRAALTTTLAGGGVAISGVERSADFALQRRLQETISAASGTDAYLQGLTQLAETVADPSLDASLPAALQQLGDALRTFEADPAKALNGQAVITVAETVAHMLNDASATVSEVRLSADQAIGQSVERINGLLRQFARANDAIVRGDGTPADMSDELDARDLALKSLAEEIGIRTVTRGRNDIAIYTDGGVTLFDRVPRNVSFAPTEVMTPAAGNHVYVDGVPVTDMSQGMASRSGRINGLAALRDDAATTYQRQLDEVARGLIAGFADRDRQVPATLPDVAGLFMREGSAAIPPPGVVAPGLATSIRVNPQAKADPELLRDGGFGGVSYVANSRGAAGFNGRIAEQIAALDSLRSFDPAGRLGAEATITGFASASAGWIEGQRSAASAAADRDAALAQRAGDALQRKTGVNIDEEMSIMLELERSYQASAKLIMVVDGMMSDLLAVV